MKEYILNGKTVKVSSENEQAFIKANPNAKIKETSWWRGEEGWIPDELEFWKRKEESPGKSIGASQPQENQTENTDSSSATGLLGFVKYKLGEKFVKVAPANTKAFEKENPEATQATFQKGTILDKITDDKDTIPQDKGYLSELVLSLKQGKRGLTTDGAFDLMRHGKNITDEKLQEWVRDVEKYGGVPQTQAQIEYNRKLEENGGGIWGHIKVMSDPRNTMLSLEWVPQQILGSLSTMATSLYGSDEVRVSAAGGAGAGAVATRSPYGGVAGAYSAGIGAMEAGLEFTELLKEELAEKGVDPNDYDNGFTADNIRSLILEDPASLEKIRKKALARGMSMAVVEAMTFGVARGTGKLVLDKTMSKSKTALAVTGTEMVGGAASEAAGQFASGGTAEPGGFSVQKGIENLDSGDIFIEGILEGPTAVLNTDILFSGSRGEKYTINGSEVTKKRVVSILQDNDLTTQEKAKILSNIEITNDKTLQSYLDKALSDINIEMNIDARVVDRADRKRLVELENQRRKAEADTKKTGVFSVSDADKKLNDINLAIEEILAPYQNQIDKNLSDVQIQRDQAAEFNQNMSERIFKSNLEFAKKHSALYGLNVNDTLTREEIRKAYGDEAADADGFIDGDQIIINSEVAQFTDAVNVGNHELLHGILRKEMKNNPNQFANIRQELSQQIGNQWQYVENRVKEAGYTEQYMIENPDEWITLTSDAIANGQITYSESVFQPLMDFILPILRAAGFKKIKFDSGKDVFEFLKEYNRSIHKGSLSSGIVSATQGVTQVEGGPKFAKSNLAGMLDRFDGNTRRMINQTVARQANGEPVAFREDKFGNYISSVDSEFGQEVMPIVESITKRLFDPIPTNIADQASVSRGSYQSDLVNEAATLVNNEYNGRQPLDQFVSNRLNLRAQSLARRLGIKSVEESSKETRINQGDSQLQVQDRDQTDTAFEEKDLSPQQQRKDLKEDTRQINSGEFVKDIYMFDNETTIEPLRQTLNEINYDASGSYEQLAADMVSQQNPAESSKNKVKPTGVLYPAHKLLSESYWQVNPNSIIAKPQTLTVPESNNIRTKIIEAIKNTRTKKGLSPVKRVVSAILPKTNLNPNTLTSIGLSTKTLEVFYLDRNIETGETTRPKNLKAQALNINNMADSDILMNIGITNELTLMPHDRKFNPILKSFVKQGNALVINQEIRSLIKDQAANIGVGRPDILFSKSVKNSYRKSPADLANDYNIKLVPGSSKTRAKNSMYNETETWAQARDRVLREYLTEYPQYRVLMQKGLCASSKRTMYTSVKEFNEAAGPMPPGVDIINALKTEYNVKRRFTPKAFKKFKTEKFKQGEAKKLETLKDFFVSIQEFSESKKIDGKVSPDMFLFLEMLRDSSTGGQAHIIRILAPVKFYTVDQRTRKPIYDKEVVEEHTDPQNQIGTALMDAAINGNVNEVFDVIGGSYMQGSLLETSDNLIANKEKNPNKRDLTRDMPDFYFDEVIPRIKSGELKLPDGMASVVRMAIQGVNLNELMLIDSNQTIAEFFNVGIDTKNMTDAQIEYLIPYQNDLIIKQLTTKTMTKTKARNSINKISKTVYKKNAKQLQSSLDSSKAIINTYKYSKSGKTRGMSTFDFDDTLGFTKSGVRANIPNNDGLPKPERKVIFLAGGAGSGKGNVIRKLNLEKDGFKIVNSDISLEWLKKNSGLPADMRDLTKEQRSTLGKLGAQARKIARGKMMKYQGNANGVVVDGTGGSVRTMQKLVDEFKSKGYDVSMIFVDTSLDVALQRNRARQERSLLDKIVIRNHEAVQGNKSSFKEMFGDRFMEVNTDNLTQQSPMPTDLVNNVTDFVSGYERRRLDAEEFAAEGDAILEQGGEFDFSEFNDVVDGTPGPLLEKARQRAAKYGTKDMFVLTARPQAAAPAIKQFLKSQGLDIPLKNITGLANSSGNAKAQWMLGKFAEGYNDMYFVDDALQNVEAVKQVLDQLDIKSDVVQAKRKFSKSASQNFNTILEESQGTNRNRTFSYQEAKRLGKNKGWWRIFVPPSAEDYKGLLYRFLGTGRQGELHMKYLKIKLLDPFAKGIRSWNIYKQEMVNEYAQLKKNLPNVAKGLTAKVGETGFTTDDAIRVYLWDKNGFNIPGIDDATKQELIDFVNRYGNVKAFADTLSRITKTQEGYVAPTENWSLGSISTDLNNVVNKVGRKQFLAEYLANSEAIFTPENMNKIEALYGTTFREALENIMYRMENGGNRRVSTDRNVNRMLNWINGSIGAIMFFNMRSALLQTISTVNFINWSDNNIFKASAAFANQPQFWTDFATLFNSPQLKQRRRGIQIDVSASELSRAFSDGKGTPQSVISWLLEKGFTPTQVADSFAISFGGASFYRNRLNKYKKQGFSEQQANEKAMLDFQEIAEETQQSSREDLISQQQASVLGRLILAFQNVTMQYTRLTKKALSDLINGRGDMKTNISKILYYGMVQNLIFASLQSALAFVIWGDDQEDIEDKTLRTANSALDSFLRGTGIYGAIVSTVKNTIIQAEKQKKKSWGREDGRTLLELTNISPPIGSKLRKIYNAIKTEQYNKGVSEELGLRIENPTLHKWASIIEATTNIPTQRLIKKANNLEEAITGNHLTWQRIALGLGWNRWDIGVKDEELEAAKSAAKSKNKSNKKSNKSSSKRCSAIKKSGGRCKNNTRNKSGRCYAHQ